MIRFLVGFGQIAGRGKHLQKGYSAGMQEVETPVEAAAAEGVTEAAKVAAWAVETAVTPVVA